MSAYIPPGADRYWGADLEAVDHRDDPPDMPELPDHIIETLAATAAWEARCEAHAWQMALGLAGGDAWVCERLALAYTGGAL